MFKGCRLLLQIDIIIVHKADQPDTVVDFLETHGLTGERSAEIDFLFVDADSSAAGDKSSRILLSDRNRADLDWSKDQLNWRYRNKVTLERRFTVNSYHPAPCVSAEVFYQSQYQKWTTTALYAGCLLPTGKHFEFDPYYEHQNVTNKRPNQQFNQFGLVLNMYF